MDIHNYVGKLEHACANLSTVADISERNRDILMKLAQHLIIQNYSKPRIMKYIYTGRFVCRQFRKDYDKWTVDDVQQYLAWVHQRSRSPWTAQWYKVFIKRLMQFVHGMDGKEYPVLVSKIKLNFPSNLLKLPNEGELLTPEEVNKIIGACKNSRDRAFVATLYESGCRISELGNMTIKHVKFDQYGAVLSVIGKTGARQVRVINSTSYLSTWLHDHPLKNSRDMPLWVTIEGKRHLQVRYQRWRQLLMELGTIAGIQKRVNPHSFRHARATSLANHLTSFQMNQYLGWKQGSDMASTYIHLSGKNTDSALLKMYGLEKAEDKHDEIKPMRCPRCDGINPHGAQFCVKCGAVLNEVAAAEIDQKAVMTEQQRLFGDKLMSVLLADPELMQLLKKKIAGITS